MTLLMRPALVRVANVGSIASLWCLLELGAAGDVAAQRIGVSESGYDSVKRMIEVVSPLSGPPGTVVTLRTANLPAVTPLRIGWVQSALGSKKWPRS